MDEIISHLHCKFYRYDEKKKALIEYFSGEPIPIEPKKML